MRGTTRKISLPRRFVIDLMRASMEVPFVSLSRPLDVRQLIAARAGVARPPGWAAIFVKAFALVARDEPILRTLYAHWPRPHFYELPRCAAMVAIARVEDGEECILMERVLGGDDMPLAEIDAQLRRAKHAPLDEVGSFRRIKRMCGVPQPLRRLGWWLAGRTGRWHATNFGNYGVTSAAASGGGELHAIGPGPFVLSYGLVRPDHAIEVVIRWDHRVTDAAPIAKTMTRLEQVLNGEISAELRGSRQAEGKPVRAVAK
ncbi:acyltransferase [Bradyrhizobium sp. STM 3562]|uniref:acyltransferase n=1 Tax=Bradyrhizobium sp. STM 3562 TaxID=578924 RepID=UPI00388F94B6